MLDTRTWLVLDASSLLTQVGVLQAQAWQALASSEDAPLENLFELTETVLAEARIDLADIAGFIVCAGPGSMLGLRLAAMAIQTWQRTRSEPAPLLQYHSLHLAAACLRQEFRKGTQPIEEEGHLLADFRKGAWAWLPLRQADAVDTPTISLISDEALPELDGPIYHLRQRKGWISPPARAQAVDYSIRALPTLAREAPLLLRPVSEPEIFLLSQPSFKRWTPERFRS